ADPVAAADAAQGGWQLSGELRFASGVDLIDRALVPAQVAEWRLLLDVPADLGKPDPDAWRAAGMDAARTFTVHVDRQVLNARRVGGDGFYVDRPGFVVGGLCVAAVWAGGAQQVLDVVSTSLRDFTTTPHQLRRLGVIEQLVWEVRSLLTRTVARLDDLPQAAVARECGLTRTAVVRACESILDEARQVVGPAGLSRNARLARVLDDLTIYVRQHQVDSALAALGESALTAHETLAG
ncbi:MAG: acyl-CoA dehydrogenase family protein, partial [Nocardioidaceae bacterium]